MIRRVRYWLILVMLMACEERIQLTVPSENLDKLVVEGVLTSENLNHQIRLSHTYMNSNEVPVPATDAVVTLSDGSSNYSLTESPGASGVYYTPVMKAITGTIYTLSITYQGETFSAHDSPVAVEAFGAASNQKIYHKEANGYRLDLSPSGQNPNYINYDLSWANTAVCQSPDSCTGKVVYYDLKTIDVNDIFKPSKEDFYFPLGTTIIRKKYSMSPAYQAYLRAVMSETEWRGGVFDVLRANVPTNVSGGAVGFFAVSTVLSDTTIVTE